jgi:hypothetical protein
MADPTQFHAISEISNTFSCRFVCAFCKPMTKIDSALKTRELLMANFVPQEKDATSKETFISRKAASERFGDSNNPQLSTRRRLNPNRNGEFA